MDFKISMRHCITNLHRVTARANFHQMTILAKQVELMIAAILALVKVLQAIGINLGKLYISNVLQLLLSVIQNIVFQKIICHRM